MDETKQPGLQIAQIFLSAAHLEHRHDALSLPLSTRIEAAIKVNATASVQEDGSQGLLVMSVATDDEKDPLYRFRVEMTALIAVDRSEPNLTVREYLIKQGPAMMYPFLREAVANLTGRGRFGPMWLRPLNLTAPSESVAMAGQAEKEG